MGQLDGKIAIITGAGLGIGRAIAQRYIEEGAQVVIGELKPEPGKLAAEELGDNAYFVQTDAGDKASVENMVQTTVDQFGTVDILVNNAWGGGKICRVENKTEDLMNHGLGIGFLGPFWAMVAAHKIMKPKGWGRIVNITSIFGIVSKEYRAPYSASKFGMDGMTVALAAEVVESGVLVNSVAPGFIDTELTRKVLGEKGMREIVAKVPIRRMGKPEEVARLVLWLASNENTFVSGQNIAIDGGFTRV